MCDLRGNLFVMGILVVVAHPDDEVLGAGGVIAKHINSGDSVTVAILSQGVTARADQQHEADPQQLSIIKASIYKAASILGYLDDKSLNHRNADNLFLYDLPDNRFDSVELLDVVKIVEGLVNQVQPDIVYTHHEGDLNIDHSITAKAVLTACRPLPGSSVKKILAFEVPSATGWALPSQAFNPTVFVDIHDTIAIKLKAIQVYETEIRPFPHARSLKSIESRAITWGTNVGLPAAEAFCLIREII